MSDATPPVGWCVKVAAYRFFIAADQVNRIERGATVQAVHHVPSWLAGVALVQGGLMGVLDLGRFLGVAKALSGCLLLPHAGVGGGWALQVHEAEPVFAQVEVRLDEDGAVPADLLAAQGMADRPQTLLLARSRPHFSIGRAVWVGDDGQGIEADRLCLLQLLAHPRLRELQS